MIIYAVLMLCFLIVIHEGGHYIAARSYGVRVTEFMIGMPGPNVGVTIGGTKFGITPILLGGYAKVCGMEADPLDPRLPQVLAAMYRRGTANMEDIALECDMSDDEAYDCLEELVEWGSIVPPLHSDKYNTYRTPAYKPSRRKVKKAQKAGEPVPRSFEQGEPREIGDPQAFYESEYKQQYRSLPFWKRSVILVAGPLVNLLFVIVAFVLVYSIIGFDYESTTTGETTHINVNPLYSAATGVMYIGAVIEAILGLFNPTTVSDVVSNSTSVVGVAVMSKEVVEAGPESVILFLAMISASLGVVNLLPIPPLDGGRFVIEVYQKISKKGVSTKVLNYLSLAGTILFLILFVVLLNQDIQRFVLGNWD